MLSSGLGGMHRAGTRLHFVNPGLNTCSRSTLPQTRIVCQARPAFKSKAPAAVHQLETASRSKLTGVLASLALTGASTGTFLDGIHSRVHLLVYDSAPLAVGGLHTSAWVPPLLATFYVALGSLVLFLDGRMAAGGDKTTLHAINHASLARMLLSVGALAGMLELSAYLYGNDVASSSICVVLALCSFINYAIFDSTKQGLALAVVCALGAPAAELVLMHSLGVWHYPQGELVAAVGGGIPRWVPFCYFFYVPWVANFSRWLWKVL